MFQPFHSICLPTVLKQTCEKIKIHHHTRTTCNYRQAQPKWQKFSNWFTHKWKRIHFNDKFILSMLHTYCRWWLWTNSPSFLHAFSWRQGVCYSFHLTSYWEKRNDEIIFTSLFTSNTSFQLFQKHPKPATNYLMVSTAFLYCSCAMLFFWWHSKASFTDILLGHHAIFLIQHWRKMPILEADDTPDTMISLLKTEYLL